MIQEEGMDWFAQVPPEEREAVREAVDGTCRLMLLDSLAGFREVTIDLPWGDIALRYLDPGEITAAAEGETVVGVGVLGSVQVEICAAPRTIGWGCQGDPIVVCVHVARYGHREETPWNPADVHGIPIRMVLDRLRAVQAVVPGMAATP